MSRHQEAQTCEIREKIVIAPLIAIVSAANPGLKFSVPTSRLRIIEWSVVAALVGSFVCAIVSPPFIAPLVMVFATVIAVTGFEKFKPDFRQMGGLIAAVVLLTWALVSLGWSIDVELTLKRSLRLFLMIAMGTLAIVFIPRIALDTFRQKLIVICAATTILVVVADSLVGFTLGRALMDGGDPLDRSGPILVLLLWPVAVLAYRSFGLLGVIVIAVATAFSIGSLNNKAALLAFCVGSIGAFVVYLRPRTSGLIVAASVTFFVAVVPAGIGVFNESIRTAIQSSHADASVRHRLFVWSFSAGKAIERPIAGWGMGTSRSVPGGEKIEEFFRRDGTVDGQGQAIPLHPHNSFIQVFLELGAIGLLLTLTSLLFLFRSLVRTAGNAGLSVPVVGFILSALVISSISFGAWQGWWVSIQLLTGALLYALAKPGPKTGTQI